MMKKKKDEDTKPVEQEIADLQRKFRVLENDKRSYSEDSQGTIRKQRATVEKLTRENRKMKGELDELRKAQSSSGPEARERQEKLAKSQDETDSMRMSLKSEVELAQTLNEKTDAVQKR